MSTLVGNILVKAAKTHPHIPGNVIASALAVIAGCCRPHSPGLNLCFYDGICHQHRGWTSSHAHGYIQLLQYKGCDLLGYHRYAEVSSPLNAGRCHWTYSSHNALRDSFKLQVCREKVSVTPEGNLLHWNTSNCFRHLVVYLD